MNRRDLLAGSVFAAGALASRSGFGASDTNDGQVVGVVVRGDRPLHTISPDFMGLGYEIASVGRPGLMSRANGVYVQLVRTLGGRGVIRVGGNTADYASYAPTAPAVSSPYGTVVNDAVLKELGSFLEATGWKLIWALDLGRGSETDAIAEARAVRAIAGDRLLAFEIGNEPDLFSHEKHRKPEYSYEDWLADYRRYKRALRAQFPGIPFAGPDVAGKTDWVTRFANDEGKDAVLLTHHYYREGQNPGSTIEKLLGADPKLQPELDQLQAASRSCGLPYRICEVNSFSGGGRPGVSDTMAGALWALDYMFTLASNGCSGVNMETGVNHRGFISSYSPIGDDEQGHYSAKPEYYGLLAFSLAGHGELLTAEVDANSAAIKAYATRPKEGTLVLTLINKGAGASALNVNMGSQGQPRQVSVIRLTGPAVDAKAGISLGGAEVTPAGTWKQAKSEVLPVRNGQLSIPMPPASAAIVQVV
jgi:Glycosyl hydrolase family 79 C-terminal beta domain